MGNKLSNTINRQDFKNKILNTTQSNINDFKLGRWGNKTHKQREIAEYWTNIDHCGDSLCGDLQKTKKFYEKEILKIKQ